MQVEVSGDIIAGYAEFRWDSVYVMPGYDFGHWMLGIEYNRYCWHCVTIHLLCFDLTIQVYRDYASSAEVPQSEKS